MTRFEQTLRVGRVINLPVSHLLAGNKCLL